MLFRGPMGGGAASGKIGAMIASHCAQGQYLKSRVKPVNPATVQQAELRNALRRLAPIWASTLTSSQRAAWATYAANVTWVNRLGDTVHLSGQMEFCRSNWPRLQCGLDLVIDAPTIFDRGSVGPAPTLTLAPASNVGTVTLDVAAPWNDSSSQTALLVYVGLPRSGGVSFFRRRTRRSAVIRASTMPLPEFGFGLPFTVPAYSQAWPAWVTATMADGRLTTPVPLAPVFTGPPPPPPWIDTIPYTNGPLDGQDSWVSPEGLFGVDPVAVSSHTLIGSPATDADALCTDARILTTWSQPWSLSFDFSVVGDNDGQVRILVGGTASGGFTPNVALTWEVGDVGGDVISDAQCVDTVPATPVEQPAWPSASGATHTATLLFDGSAMELLIDGTSLGSGAATCVDGPAGIYIELRNFSSGTTIAVSNFQLQQSR